MFLEISSVKLDDSVEASLPALGAERAADGHARSVAKLAERYWRPLTVFFMRKVRSSADAKDLAQEVFLRVLRRRDAPDIQNAGAFLFQTAANLLHDRQRKESVRRQYLTDTPIHEPVNEVLTPERVLAGKEEMSALLKALGELEEDTRVAFVLYHLENMKYREIAEVMQLSLSQAERHVAKAMAYVSARIARP